ncbi:Por secretion system C-terminal sorting domain-containing protein [Soonwooa buanensis]|uniref:Por secretion system C-terminal sorting domain-containing protein n=1 Tax=Soonwooa buanensis TaxID=619805 RepID=A0A1T5G280_9FLAO|nr:T9SS type A sorting domain-containing protein [Soonwooa buanensis]SKC02384.1 Por secretion system C-terminal sorting domain-containing protein [Soonwooa buanensis]
MKKIYLGVAISLLSVTSLFSQKKFNFLNQTFGTAIYGINKNGEGVMGLRYYNFATNTLTAAESQVGTLASINDNGQYAGATFLDEVNYIFQPSFKKSSNWQAIPWFSESVPSQSQFTTYKISPNGKWVVGQMSIGTEQYGMFIFNTETMEMKRVIGGDYEHYAAYSVNDNGIVVGWADLLGVGTKRTPVYLNVNDMQVHEFLPTPSAILNAAGGINANNIIVGNYENQAFYYDLNNNNFQSLDNPAGSISCSLMDISNTGVAVGFASMGGNSRKAVIYHPSMGNTPMYLTDFLSSNGIDFSTATDQTLGTASTISSDGKYIGGFINSTMAAFAYGWAVYLDDATLGTTNNLTTSKISIYPNPVADKLSIKTNEKISNVEVYNIAGTKTQILKTQNNEIDVRHLLPGTYIIKSNIGNKVFSEKFIKK